MSYSFIQYAQNELLTPATSVSTGAFSVGNVTAGNLIAVIIFCVTGQTVSSVTDTLGNTYVQAGSGTVSAGLTEFGYYAKNITGGACTVTANFSASTADSGIVAIEYSGLDKVNALQGWSFNDQLSPGTGTDAVTSGNMTPGFQPCALVGFSGPIGGGTAPTAGTGFTNRATVLGSGTLEDKLVTSLAATAATFTATSGTFEHGTMGFLFALATNLAGQTATFSEGTLSVSLTDGLTGQTTTFSMGVLTPAITYGLTAQSLTSSEGSLSPALTYSLAAQTVHLSEGTITPFGGNTGVSQHDVGFFVNIGSLMLRR